MPQSRSKATPEQRCVAIDLVELVGSPSLRQPCYRVEQQRRKLPEAASDGSSPTSGEDERCKNLKAIRAVVRPEDQRVRPTSITLLDRSTARLDLEGRHP